MLLPFALFGCLLPTAPWTSAPYSATAEYAQQQADGELAVVDYDPVEACFGQHVAGSADRTRTRGRFVYRFASDETLAIFDAEPERYAVQVGGACARMGSLSGLGNPALYTVYKGRLYFFASEGCRSGFLAKPAAHLWSPDPQPAPSDVAVREGRALVARALQAMGGKDALIRISTLTLSAERTHGSGPDAPRSSRLLRFDFTGDMDLVRRSGDWSQTIHVRGDKGVLIEDGQVFPLEPSQRLAARRELHGEPVWLLAQRNDPSFRFWAEQGPQGDVLACHQGGITTRLELDGNGRVLAVIQRRRDPSLGFTTVRTKLGPPQDVDGLQLALERRPEASGRPVEGLRRSWVPASVNEPLNLPPQLEER